MVLHGELPEDAPTQVVSAGGSDQYGIDGEVNAVTSEEQTEDQRNVRQGKPVASVQSRELQ